MPTQKVARTYVVFFKIAVVGSHNYTEVTATDVLISNSGVAIFHFNGATVGAFSLNEIHGFTEKTAKTTKEIS